MKRDGFHHGVRLAASNNLESGGPAKPSLVTMHLEYLLQFLALPREAKRRYIETWPNGSSYLGFGSGTVINDPFLAILVESHDTIEMQLPMESPERKQVLSELWGLLACMFQLRRLDALSEYWWMSEVSWKPVESQMDGVWRIVSRLATLALNCGEKPHSSDLPPIEVVLSNRIVKSESSPK